MKTENKPPLPLGTEINPHGKISGIHSRGGERSYFFVNKKGAVSLIPAELVEEKND